MTVEYWSFTYDLTTTEGIAELRRRNPGAVMRWRDEQIVRFARAGGTLQELIEAEIIRLGIQPPVK